MMTGHSIISLPYEVLLNILNNINLRDLRNLMLTCKTLRDIIINENAIWKWAFRNKFVLKTKFNSYLKPLSYYNQCRISNAWSKGIYRNKVIIQHHDNYMPWLSLFNSEMLFLSLRSSLTCYSLERKGFPKVREILWSLEVPKVLRNDVRTNDISRFIIKDNIIVCGNRDGSSAVYSFNYHQRPKLLYHLRDCHDSGQSEVSAVEVISNKSNPCIITASGNSSELSLWCWQWNENTCDSLPQIEHKVFDCNEGFAHTINIGVRSLAVNESQDKLVIGLNGNSKPLLLDINTYNLLMKANETRNARQAIRDIQWHDEHTIVFVTHSGILQLIDIRNNSIVYDTMDPFQSSLYCVKSDGDHAIIVGSSEYSRCVLYDNRFKHHIQMYFTQKVPSPVYSLDFDSTKLVAAADRSTAALNFNVNIRSAPVRNYSHTFEIVQNRSN